MTTLKTAGCEGDYVDPWQLMSSNSKLLLSSIFLSVNKKLNEVKVLDFKCRTSRNLSTNFK